MDIGIVGASGRMGQALIALVKADEKLHLKGVSDRADSALIGHDIGSALFGRENGVVVADNPLDAFKDCQAVIDFSTPASSLQTAEITAQTRAVHVIGTTGFSKADYEALEAAARHAVIVHAGNMSLGVNLLMTLVERTARALGVEYDIEVIEAHHRHKVDAPSGTALMLGQAAAKGRDVNLDDVLVGAREGITGERKAGDIGFSVIRGGDIIGEHEVVFAGTGERIALSHKASDRSLFARGALQAAIWGQDQPPGFYSMQDVLGLD